MVRKTNRVNRDFDVVVFHDVCHDGITALWAAKQAYPDAEPYPGKYHEEPDYERLAYKRVLVVDFSWKRPTMLKLREVTRDLLVLDHHKTAEKELEGLDFCVFDMGRSGAGLAWDELVGGPRPLLIDYVEDRDLWRFDLPSCREVHYACNSFPLTLEARTVLMARTIESLVVMGEPIVRYHDKLVQSAAKWALRETIDRHNVPSICCPIVELVSDLGHTLAEDEPFAAVWSNLRDGGRQVSLRSCGVRGLDVGEIAAKFGGGGHRNSAGYTDRQYWRSRG